MSEDRAPPSRPQVITFGWMIAAIVFVLSVKRLEELAPFPLLFAAVVVLFGLGPLALLAWAFRLRRHKRQHAILIGTSVLLTVLCIVAGAGWILKTGAQLNFEAHKNDYDAVVRDAKAGRLSGVTDGGGVIRGESNGVAFIYDKRHPDRVEFPWTINSVFAEGVVYDEHACEQGECRGDALDRNYRHKMETN